MQVVLTCGPIVLSRHIIVDRNREKVLISGRGIEPRQSIAHVRCDVPERPQISKLSGQLRLQRLVAGNAIWFDDAHLAEIDIFPAKSAAIKTWTGAAQLLVGKVVNLSSS